MTDGNFKHNFVLVVLVILLFVPVFLTFCTLMLLQLPLWFVSSRQTGMATDWAPKNVGWERRMQTLAVFIICFAPQICIFSFVGCHICILMWLVTPFYFFWVLKDRAAQRGGRPIQWVQSLPLWQYARDYFPVKFELHPDAKFDPSVNYFMILHPHGVLIPHGTFINVSTTCSGLREALPGINIRLLTLSVNFYVPFLRDYLLSMGACDASKESINFILSKAPKGTSCMLVVGGAEEATDCRPGYNDLVLDCRKGFIKLALQNGSPLVPVYGFGENYVYDNVLASASSTSLLRRVTTAFKKKAGYIIPILNGRGLFNYSWGLIPRRHKIVTVFGPPIPVNKVDTPTIEQIDELHATYKAALTSLYHTYKDKYDKERHSSIRFVK